MNLSWFHGTNRRPAANELSPESATPNQAWRWMGRGGWLLVVVLAVALSVGLPLFAISRDNSEQVRLRQAELQLIQGKCDEIEVRNQQLRNRIRALQEDPRYLETTARAELGWVREGELIYHFEPAAPRRPQQ